MRLSPWAWTSASMDGSGGRWRWRERASPALTSYMLAGQRDRVGDEVARDERRNADHREAAVLELGRALARQLLRRELGREAERVPEQRDLAGRAARHVVRLHRRLAQQLQDANHAQDLELAVLRHSVPRGVARRRQAGEGDALRRREVAREGRAARRDVAPARRGRHGDAPVLELSGAVPGERL